MTSPTSLSFIRLKGCREHNLKNFTLSIPKQAITAFVGVSGSGKSSLAFDTLFAEGQRRYLEYLSSQARMWIKQMDKPNVDLIEGLSPTLAVEQRKTELFARGTVATYTDIYDFLALLFANLGIQHSPVTGKKLIKYSRQEITLAILKEYPTGSKIQLLAPIKLQRENGHQAITRLEQMGFIRLKIQGEDWTNDQPIPPVDQITQLDVVIDRLEIKEGIRDRLASSIETALNQSQGILKVQLGNKGPIHYFTEIYVCPETSLSFAPLKPVDFNFNSPHGACPTCYGQGGQDEIVSSLLFKEKNHSLIEQVNAILDHLPKKVSSSFFQLSDQFCRQEKINEETTVKEISKKTLEKYLYGTSQTFEVTTTDGKESHHFKAPWQGLVPFLNRILEDKKIRGSLPTLPCVKWKECSMCQGTKLKPESRSCLIHGKSIDALCQQTVTQLIKEIDQWTFSPKEELIAREILPDIQNRLRFLEKVGLGYLQLNRQGKTLSDGEAQRIRLASQIGAKLSGIIYILDEPSLGLHRQDIEYLQEVIQELKELGNTIILVEHERGLISQADHILELGPEAGKQGGYITFEGSYEEMLTDENCLTGQWLSGRKSFPKHSPRKAKQGFLKINSASLHNIHDLNLKIPLGCLVGFCGVSGSGKSTLVLDMIGQAIQEYLSTGTPIPFLENYTSIKRLVLGEKLTDRFSARSIPATYVDIMTPLRQLFADTRLAKARGYNAARFSLNKRGGRCEACEGLGEIKVNMQLMPDLFLPCDVCLGERYNYETLQVFWENRNIAQILSFSVDEAATFFRNIPTLAPPLKLMQELRLGYLSLGQPFHTLSGGEIQRLRLVGDLITKTHEPTLYILDEPSAGLHFEDIQKLMVILHRLVDQGHSVFVIEHHLELLQQADWIIEMGPHGGPEGGKIVFEGTTKQLAKASTPTGKIFKF